jgi:MFS transporter, DHA2 family, glioxin efflux transporter
MVIGSSLFTIGAGLLYTLEIGTPLANAIGYQVLLGVGQGIGIQMPIIVGQAFSQPADMSSTTAIVLCELYTVLVRPAI